MSYIIRSIAGDDLQKHITSSKFCKINSRSCVINGKFGLANINLTQYTDAKSCQLKLKRLSGNGLMAIIGDNQETINYTITSKISETITINIENSKQFNILRPASGIGDIELIGIVLLSDEKSSNDNTDLRTELSKCNRKGIRAVGKRYFANEGSRIASSDISYIETEPPAMFSRDGNEIIFRGLCEIIRLKVGKAVEPVDPPNYIKSVQKGSELVPAKNLKTVGYETSLERALTFDYKPSDKDEIKTNSDVCLFADGMTLGRYGAINIPSLPIKDGSRYVLIIKAKNIDGNGRITLNISNTSIKNHSVYVGPDDLLKIQFMAHSGDFTLLINRGGPSTGNVWISRVSVVPYSVVYGDVNEFVGIRDSGQNDIEHISKRFSLMKREVFEPAQTFDDIYGVIAARGFSSNSWLNKIQPLFPNIKIQSDTIKVPKIYDNTDLLIGELGDLKMVKKIWLNEFQGQPVSEKDLNILSQAKVISSSLPNVQFLRNKHGINVTYLPKIWPYIDPIVPEYKPYVLVLNRHTQVTKSFIQMYKGSRLPPLVVTGLRGNPGVKVTSEYLDYKTLIGLILHASVVVDLSVCTHYMSAALDISFMAGVPIVTTNQWMSISKPSCYQISVEMKNGKFTPNIPDCIKKIEQAIKSKNTKKNFDMSSYNLNLYGSIRTALEL